MSFWNAGFVILIRADLDLTDIIARAPMQRAASVEQWEKRTNSTLKVVGRHVLNVWRVMRKELTLNIYTFENVVFQVLQRRSNFSLRKT